MYHPKAILVTGGAGFIGTNYINHILQTSPELRVVNLDSLTYAACREAALRPECENYHFVEGDINNASLVAKTLRDHQIDGVVHFAAESHVDRSIAGPAAFITTNIVGTFTLLEAVRHYWLDELGLDADGCRFHHISTDEVYGSLAFDDPAFMETTPYDPRSPYSASKASSDHLVNAYHHTYGLPITMSNCSNNYGPYQHAEKLIPTVINSCLKRQPIPVYGKGKNVRDWIFVEDHCRAIAEIFTNGALGCSYNVGGGNEWRNIELVQFICEVLDQMAPWQGHQYQELISFVSDRQGHDLRYAIASERLQTVYADRLHTIQEKLPETIAWYLEQFQQNDSATAMGG